MSDRLVDWIRLPPSNFRVSSLILTWLALYVRFLPLPGVLLTLNMHHPLADAATHEEVDGLVSVPLDDPADPQVLTLQSLEPRA